MAERGKPWHVCDDCLEPLAGELFALANRFRVHFDVAKSDRLDAEYRQIQEASWCDDRLTEAQRNRRDELLKQMSAQKEPPRPFDVECLYRDYKIDLATDWLKFNVSVEYAADFHRTLTAAQKRFSALDFKACQIINGDLGKESTVQIRYAIQRLIDRHYELLREQFPNHESHPDRDELPDDLRAFEVEILDEYAIVEQQFRKTAEYLRRVSALVRSKLAKAQAPIAVGLIDRLLAGPDHAELTPSELAMLEAHLQQPISLAAIQQEKRATGESETNAKRNKLKLIRDYNRNLQSALTPKQPATAEPLGESVTPTKAKRSTERGEGRAKLIAALTKHHKYADGGCLNMEPIGNNELARLAEVSESTASAFFNKEFNGSKSGGHAKYRAICSDATRLVAALKLLNQEFSPHHLFGAKPANESEREDDE